MNLGSGRVLKQNLKIKKKKEIVKLLSYFSSENFG